MVVQGVRLWATIIAAATGDTVTLIRLLKRIRIFIAPNTGTPSRSGLRCGKDTSRRFGSYLTPALIRGLWG